MSRELFRFSGGVHLAEHKNESNSRPIQPPPLPKHLIIPLCQHAGTRAQPIVAVGERVLKGEMIALADSVASAAIHASSSGTVQAIDMQILPHASGLSDLCITINTDGLDEWVALTPLHYRTCTANELRTHLRDLGLVGLGGPTEMGCTTLILNGTECEPWITCDDVLMRHHASQIMQGIAVMQRLSGSITVLIGIEDNKPEALAAMQSAATKLDFAVEVIAVPTRYPSGGDKQLIKTLTGLEVPSGKLPTNIGIQFFNVATAYALYRAVFLGEPVISRVVTVTGHVLRPQNITALIGTPMLTLIQMAGEREGRSGVVMGGPMMGMQMPAEHVPVVQATNCILVKSAALFPPPPGASPCIRCARCAQACPANLQPQELLRFAQVDDFDRAQAYHLFDCIECGCCSYVCPSHIPLVDFYRYAKSEILQQQQAQQAADLARSRYEFRLFRQTREKAEKAEEITARAQAQSSATTLHIDPQATTRQAQIAAAIARAQAKKSATASRTVEPSAGQPHQQPVDIEAPREQLILPSPPSKAS